MIGRAMRADLAPVLVFAPRRAAAEQIAQTIASALPVRDPLRLTPAQETTAGKSLTKLLRNRVAYHHSGLSYAARAGVVESLAKAGQLNVVVATMGLAAGINFSMRSVIVTDRRYFAGNFERQVEADELLQMFGRAGRRGLDEVGHALYTNDLPRLSDTKARQLRRAAQVDWPSLISVMHAAKQRSEQPFAAAVQLTQSLFSVQRVPLGVEHALKSGPRPCGLWVTDERARFVRRGMIEMLNSREEWEAKPAAERMTFGRAFVRENDRWRRALTVPRMLDGVGTGNLCRLREQNHYGRELPVATVLPSGEVALVKWLKKEIGARCEPHGQLTSSHEKLSRRRAERPMKKDLAARRGIVTHEQFETQVRSQLVELVKPGTIVDWIMRGNLLSLRLDYANVPVNAHIDSAGNALIDPPERENLPDVCRTCDQLEHDKTVAIVNSPTYAWRYLGLVEPDGTPTRRGMIFSFFHGGEGLGGGGRARRRNLSDRRIGFRSGQYSRRPSLSPARTRRWAGGSAFCASESTAGPIIQVTSPWARRCSTAPVHRKWCARWWLIRAPSTSSPANCCVTAISNARWWSGAAYFATSSLRLPIRCRAGRT